ncbi:nucleotidyltransferase domain-containing protein [Candidatus Bathyarchaeota archaeon]|nr:nucleotidyltransferase domain-containing protein [Candidatus Bathyarchaeota archaeon]
MEKRSLVAKEAARLLYYNIVNEYIQAKELAIKNIGVKTIPSNFEVAEELDKITDEIEGTNRQKRLIEMRLSAKKIMTDLVQFEPRLIGSVWRGTINQGSDIDIVVLASNYRSIDEIIKKYDLIEKGEVTFKGGIKAYHYKIKVDEFLTEIVIRRPDEYNPETCDIYGDKKTGLSIEELEKLLKTDSLRRFIPKRRIKG